MVMAKYDPDTWYWWAGSDEERYTVGPRSSRAEAISDGITEFAGEPFYIIEAKHGRAHWRIIDADRLAERFDEANEEMADPDGDGLAAEITDAAWNELAERLNNVCEAWGREKSIQVWGFSKSRNAEHFDPTVAHAWAELDAEAREAILHLIDALKTGEAWRSQLGILDPLIEATNPAVWSFTRGMRDWARRIADRKWRAENEVAMFFRGLQRVFPQQPAGPTP